MGAMGQSRKKILMLHGFVQSGKIFSSKTGGLRKSLNKLGFDLYYPTAPLVVTKEELIALHNINKGSEKQTDVASEFNTTNGSADEYTGWWKRKSQGKTDFDIEQHVFSYLHDYVIENGPFEGIVGFSQGAAFAGYLLTNFNKLLNLTEENQPPFKFFVAFSGFRLEAPHLQESFEEHPIIVPSLHVLGEQDTVVTESRVLSLFNSCQKDDRILLRHPGGHFVPNSKKFVAQVCNWIQMIDKEPNETHSEKNKINPMQPDLGDDLLDTIDSMMGSVKIRD
ncbi:FSH3 (YOR280C) [Zygosaccharomyces parabailii]|nr:FSH3 (YOR280C) [Zygosaccharomyces parabailii]CDH10057.1 related to Family of serine hydrolases 3 [Zygosaccharomyces bailii ISA1307]